MTLLYFQKSAAAAVDLRKQLLEKRMTAALPAPRQAPLQPQPGPGPGPSGSKRKVTATATPPAARKAPLQQQEPQPGPSGYKRKVTPPTSNAKKVSCLIYFGNLF
jgi:hypothetical protein